METPAAKAVQDLLDKKVITPVSTPTEWCSPAFFVGKKETNKVRMVTDFTKLNKYVQRAVHPFPAAQEIIQSIPRGSKFYAKLEAVHGLSLIHI